MYIAILGRQPALSIAELERVFDNVEWFSDTTAIFDADTVDVQRLGGTQKAGKVVLELPGGDWHRVSQKIVQYYKKQWAGYDGKITLGLSAYGFDVSIRDIQKTGIVLKAKLKNSGTSLRLLPNKEAELNTATSHHNKLGLSPHKVELLVVRSKRGLIVAESVGAQNITALAARDQGRPRRDAFVGMLPPKLAQIMINLAGPLQPSTKDLNVARILDPFCGTGVLLQEAMLLGYGAYGTDLNEKMVRYSRDNLNWLQETYKFAGHWYLHEGDATNTTWQKPVDAVVAETYLGQPFSAPPSATKLGEVRGNCDFIIRGFLKNLAQQIDSGTPVILAVPAWRNKDGQLTHLPLTNKLEKFGFTVTTFETVKPSDLVYFRPDQIVARQLLVLTKS